MKYLRHEYRTKKKNVTISLSCSSRLQVYSLILFMYDYEIYVSKSVDPTYKYKNKRAIFCTQVLFPVVKKKTLEFEQHYGR